MEDVKSGFPPHAQRRGGSPELDVFRFESTCERERDLRVPLACPLG
ncbi:MAG: hypothetical protein ABIH29_05460 [Candidatus Micrarchaeota archaeon]